MNHITEPHQLVSCADMIELIEAWEKYCDLIEEDHKNRHAHHYEKATKNLRKFNRRTLSN